MSKRLYVAGSFVVALLALSPDASLAQAPRRDHITVEWQNAALSDVVSAFARFSGRTIVMAPEVRPSLVTFAAHDVEWSRAFDSMLAEQALVARVDTADVIHVENRVASPPQGRTRG